MQLVGGADNLSAAIQAVAAAAVPATVVLLGLRRGRCRAYCVGAGGLGDFSALPPPHRLAMAAELHGSFLDQRDPPALERADPGQHKYLRNKEEELCSLRETEEKKTAEENRGWEDRAAMIRRSYFKALDELKDKQGAYRERPADDAVDGRLAGAGRGRLPQRRQQRLEDCRGSQNRRATLEAQYSDLMFKRWTDEDVKFGDSQKARHILAELGAWRPRPTRRLPRRQTEDDVRRSQAIRSGPTRT